MVNKRMSLAEYFQEYIKLYFHPDNRSKNGSEVWEMLEQWHEEKIGDRKCKSYETFRALKSKWYASNAPD